MFEHFKTAHDVDVLATRARRVAIVHDMSASCVARLMRELKAFRASPPDLAPVAHVDARDCTQWHILCEGVPNSPYEDGWYVVKITFAASYPFAAPSVRVLTPNGRFVPGQSICMSMTEWHQEMWNPAWNVGTIVTGLLSFMAENEVTSGGMTASDEERRALAKASVEWNAKQANIAKMFPELTNGALEGLRFVNKGKKKSERAESEENDAGGDVCASTGT